MAQQATGFRSMLFVCTAALLAAWPLQEKTLAQDSQQDEKAMSVLKAMSDYLSKHHRGIPARFGRRLRLH